VKNFEIKSLLEVVTLA